MALLDAKRARLIDLIATMSMFIRWSWFYLFFLYLFFSFFI
jgi:hypothetical protein